MHCFLLIIIQLDVIFLQGDLIQLYLTSGGISFIDDLCEGNTCMHYVSSWS